MAPTDRTLHWPFILALGVVLTSTSRLAVADWPAHSEPIAFTCGMLYGWLVVGKAFERQRWEKARNVPAEDHGRG